MQQRHILRRGRRNFEAVARLVHQPTKIETSQLRRLTVLVSDDEDVLQTWEPRAQFRDLAPIEPLRRDEHARIADRHARMNRLGPEYREHRTEHVPVFQRAERRDVQLRNPLAEREDPFAGRQTEMLQHVRETVRQRGKLRVTEVVAHTRLVEPAQRYRVAATGRDVAVDRFVRDVETASARQPGQVRPRRVPVERCAYSLVVEQIRQRAQFVGVLPDDVHQARSIDVGAH